MASMTSSMLIRPATEEERGDTCTQRGSGSRTTRVDQSTCGSPVEVRRNATASRCGRTTHFAIGGGLTGERCRRRCLNHRDREFPSPAPHSPSSAARQAAALREQLDRHSPSSKPDRRQSAHSRFRSIHSCADPSARPAPSPLRQPPSKLSRRREFHHRRIRHRDRDGLCIDD